MKYLLIIALSKKDYELLCSIIRDYTLSMPILYFDAKSHQYCALWKVINSMNESNLECFKSGKIALGDSKVILEYISFNYDYSDDLQILVKKIKDVDQADFRTIKSKLITN